MTEPAVKIGMAPPHPGEFIHDEILNELGLSISAAAEVLGVRRATLSDLVNGKAALSPEMALRIEKAFGMSMDTLLRMQTWHDTHAMRLQADTITVKPYRSIASPDGRPANVDLSFLRQLARRLEATVELLEEDIDDSITVLGGEWPEEAREAERKAEEERRQQGRTTGELIAKLEGTVARLEAIRARLGEPGR